MSTSPYILRIELPFGPHWPHVELLRTSILNCLMTVFAHLDFCNAAGMVAGELLENAISYGDWRNPACSLFRLEVHANEEHVCIRVVHPVDPDGDSIARLRAVIHHLETTSPSRAYTQRLREIGEGAPGKSRLGLLRCAYEAGCKLRMDMETPSILRVSATIDRALAA